MLGQSHAENDQDRLAISCLERAVEMDPYSLDALLVSTNTSFFSKARFLDVFLRICDGAFHGDSSCHDVMHSVFLFLFL